MTPKKPNTTPKTNTSKIVLHAKDETERKRHMATVYLSPEFTATGVVMTYSPDCGLDLVETVSVMLEHHKAVAGDDMRHVEAMLLSQAHALQSMFANLAHRAKQQTGLPQIQTIMGLALKAQSQCRATLQTLSDVKYPKQATFIKQANIASQQQVNNGKSPSDSERSARGKNSIQTNELLKDAKHETKNIGLDAGTACPASGADRTMATMGKIDGSEDAGR